MGILYLIWQKNTHYHSTILTFTATLVEVIKVPSKVVAWDGSTLLMVARAISLAHRDWSVLKKILGTSSETYNMP